MRKLTQESKKVLDALTNDLQNPGDHKKIENGAYMPLSIEVIGSIYGDEGKLISLCHYGEMKGDLMRDPEMCLIKFSGEYFPYYFRNDYVGVERQAVEFDNEGNGIAKVDEREQRDQASFANTWMKNLKDQGFIKASLVFNARALLSKEKATLKEVLGEEQYQKACEVTAAQNAKVAEDAQALQDMPEIWREAYLESLRGEA